MFVPSAGSVSPKGSLPLIRLLRQCFFDFSYVLCFGRSKLSRHVRLSGILVMIPPHSGRLEFSGSAKTYEQAQAVRNIFRCTWRYYPWGTTSRYWSMLDMSFCVRGGISLVFFLISFYYDQRAMYTYIEFIIYGRGRC